MQLALPVTVATVASVTLTQPQFQVCCWCQTEPLRVHGGGVSFDSLFSSFKTQCAD